MNKPSLVASGDKQGSFSRKNLFNYWILSSGAIKEPYQKLLIKNYLDLIHGNSQCTDSCFKNATFTNLKDYSNQILIFLNIFCF
jgi:hypothetical protein